MPTDPTQALRERLARRIRELAKREGVTLTDLADRAGVSQAGFWLAMSGKSAPSLDFLAKIATALKVDPDELIKRYRSTKSSAK